MREREVGLKWTAIEPVMNPDDRVAATLYLQEEVLAFGARYPIQGNCERRYSFHRELNMLAELLHAEVTLERKDQGDVRGE